MYEIVQAYNRYIHEVHVGTMSNHLIISRPLAPFDYENVASYMVAIARAIQVNLDMTDSMGPGILVRHMQNPLYTYDEYLICIRL